MVPAIRFEPSFNLVTNHQLTGLSFSPRATASSVLPVLTFITVSHAGLEASAGFAEFAHRQRQLTLTLFSPRRSFLHVRWLRSSYTLPRNFIEEAICSLFLIFFSPWPCAALRSQPPLMTGGAARSTSTRYFILRRVDDRSRRVRVIIDRYALPAGADTTACDPADQTWCGGTWNTLRENLDYIQNMGFTAGALKRSQRRVSRLPLGCCACSLD